MPKNRRWSDYEPTYRAAEMETLAGWMALGHSGSVVGPGGSGKSNVLNFLCHRPEVIKERYLPADESAPAIVPVDLNSLTGLDLATLFRVILRSFYEGRQHLPADSQPLVTSLYREARASQDPFLAQSALRELLADFQQRAQRVVLVMDRFDIFCEQAGPEIFNSLRNLRDTFKDTLSYLVGMRQPLTFMETPEKLGEMRELLDRRTLWVGSFEEADARTVIAEETIAGSPPTEAEIGHILALTGGYPALLKVVCSWWLAHVSLRATMHR